VDVGTGDGLFVYRSAQRHPRTLFIGIDANRRPLEKISEKIHRRPDKGGLPNLLFVQASVEDLPAEIDAIAAEVFVQFPWGSLLRGVAAGDKSVLCNLRRICLPEARLHITIGIDPQRDRREWERLDLPPLSTDHVRQVLSDRYRNAGFRIIEIEEVSKSNRAEFQTSWAKRLATGSGRSFLRIEAEAGDAFYGKPEAYRTEGGKVRR
jgi:16S rRNA (adenine(1408)-N(1))-methyltransferase